MNAPLQLATLNDAELRFKKPVRASLHFRPSGGKTYLAHQHTPHPFHITRPFAIAGDPPGMATLYLQSSAGGLYHDDDHNLAIDVDEDASAHITSQASTIIHDAHEGLSKVHVDLSVGNKGWLEFCPEPAILFPGSRLKSSLTAKVETDSRLIICDAQLCHDPRGESAPFDYLDNEIRLERPEGDTFYVDRSFVAGHHWFLATDNRQCAGTFLVHDAEHCELVTAALDSAILDFDPAQIYAGQTHFPDRSLAVVRMVAKSGADLTQAMQMLWQATRIVTTGHLPTPRRK